MKVGIGLPNHVAGVNGPVLVEWARRAEERGFESVTTIDRLIYPGLDSIVALAVAAGATTTTTLVTNVLLAPLYPPVLLAKQLASLADASGGRLVLGVAVGGRPDDYVSAGTEFATRGKRLDAATAVWRRVWAGETVDGGLPLGPAPVTIPVLFGGKSSATLRRATTLGDGWAAGAVRDYPAQSSFADRVRSGWRAADRPGRPILQASLNVTLGDADVVEDGRRHLGRYYAFTPDYCALSVADMVSTPADALDAVRAYRDLGFDRLLFHPAVAGLDQVDRLADAVL
ncbi:luciferase [Mycolicibacterium madagascariense]|uniref:Luciferase n=1 Tax=Mycolicibacterium madagascariense TaxID=212765 RepID=A0A7I7XF07_9MYCO|nr:LLM class flavin-dependent oxidoreductase [Mycolicibacterium madagascariense]MCV7015464.1 LLM class flavin-dependent oxidoreductase [Mycolicibacterium madagascariense]BBZ27763.1 luciferase [Mycolicibacterium madagascariense]